MIAAIGSSAAIALGLVYFRTRVGPLLLLRRSVDRARAALDCLRLTWHAAQDEWRRMWPSCLARAQREK